MNVSATLNQARAMATSAKSGALTVDGKKYVLTFDHSRWLYDVTDSAGNYVTNFNTKSLKQARQWLREWLAN